MGFRCSSLLEEVAATSAGFSLFASSSDATSVLNAVFYVPVGIVQGDVCVG